MINHDKLRQRRRMVALEKASEGLPVQSSNRRKVLQLWKHDSRCHWCGRETTVLPARILQPLPPHRATLDHLYPKRERHKVRSGAGQTVLACHECNNLRGEMSASAFRILRWKPQRRQKR